MQECIFCKIIRGEIPSTKIYENDKILAFLDIAPINPGHTLVVPKAHYSTLLETPEEILTEMIIKVKKVALAVLCGLKIDGFNLGLNNGKLAGQVVPHVHFHIIPRIEGDGLKPWPQRKYKMGEAEKVARKIREAMEELKNKI